MTPDLLEILACPDCRGALSLTASSHDEGRIDSGTLRCASCERTFPIVRHIPRFVPADTYASSFGFQWNTFRTTQLDSHTGLPISRERLIKESRWTLADLAGKRVLDVGCGAGRCRSTPPLAARIGRASGVVRCPAGTGQFSPPRLPSDGRSRIGSGRNTSHTPSS